MSETIETLKARIRQVLNEKQFDIEAGPAISVLMVEHALEEPYEMPRTPGWYLDKNGDPIRVDGDRYKRPGQHANNDFHYRKFAPFTRLIEQLEASTNE